jgi:hypothetical protein
VVKEESLEIEAIIQIAAEKLLVKDIKYQPK